jgi:hypothetical protein
MCSHTHTHIHTYTYRPKTLPSSPPNCDLPTSLSFCCNSPIHSLIPLLHGHHAAIQCHGAAHSRGGEPKNTARPQNTARRPDVSAGRGCVGRWLLTVREHLLQRLSDSKIAVSGPLAESTIITWHDFELNSDVAISFQEQIGCEHIWWVGWLSIVPYPWGRRWQSTARLSTQDTCDSRNVWWKGGERCSRHGANQLKQKDAINFPPNTSTARHMCVHLQYHAHACTRAACRNQIVQVQAEVQKRASEGEQSTRSACNAIKCSYGILTLVIAHVTAAGPKHEREPSGGFRRISCVAGKEYKCSE